MKRILVADDSVTIQKVIALTFTDEPFEVQSVGTGSEALELAKSWKPEIVLADVIMPQMNGYELCKAIKQLEEARNVPVLLLAGTFEAFDEEEAKSVGADDFITKPFESGELIEKVKTLTGDAPAAPPVRQPPVVEEEPIPAEPAEVPEAGPAAEAPPPGPVSEAAEPDIWDILSESGDDVPAAGAAGVDQAPGFDPIEDTGVVDVGSFDVGIGRPESEPAPPRSAADAPPEAPPVPEIPVPPTEPESQPPAQVPPADTGQQDMDEKSRVKNMEKDFFGFETGAVEEASATDFLDEAVEEVTFEMETHQDPQEPASQEASFVVPEPAGEQAIVTGETISPDIMAPEPAADDSERQAAAMGEEAEDKPEQVAVTVPDSIEIPEFIPEPASDAELQPEPPMEFPVDLTPELTEEFSPEPAQEPAAAVPPEIQPEPPAGIQDDPGPEVSGGVPLPDVAGMPDDEAIKKMVEEKVERIVWEVVPEMAEVIIREAIQKIKNGS